MEKNLRLNYDKLALHYEKEVDEKPFNAYYERPAMIKAIGKVRGLTVLDAGCGAGFYTKWLADNGAKEVIGIDFSKNMIEAAKRRAGNKAKIIETDLNKKLPFENNYFDMIISSLTLHYVRNIATTLKEFNRVLKQNGKLIFSIHHPLMTYLHFQIENYFDEVLLEDKINKIPVYFYHRSFTTIFKALNENGFLVEDLLEPKPTEKFKEYDRENYIKLNKKPHFLIIKTLKYD
ncbi:MAG: class I SAM-dependent methyltransferase [Thermosipho sp. (in: Bacteria)]|nr:class I SAM-dependent methyltransferase [Thermosipho sp. (in: thermotogales)]